MAKFDEFSLWIFYPVYLTLFLLSAKAVYDLGDTLEGRNRGTSWASEKFCILYLLYNGITLITCFLTSGLSYVIQVSIHHFVTCFSVMDNYCNQRGQFYACLAGMSEITNLFLNMIYLSKHYPWMKKTKLYLINGACLWFGFIAFRLVLFPYWLYLRWVDIKLYEDVPNDSLYWTEKYWYPFTIVTILILSIFWFYKITLGFLKALSGKTKDLKAE